MGDNAEQFRVPVEGGSNESNHAAVLPASEKSVSRFGNVVTYAIKDPSDGRLKCVSEWVTHDEGTMFYAMGNRPAS